MLTIAPTSSHYPKHGRFDVVWNMDRLPLPAVCQPLPVVSASVLPFYSLVTPTPVSPSPLCPPWTQELGNVALFAWPQLSSFSVETADLSTPPDGHARAGNAQATFVVMSCAGIRQVFSENFLRGL